MLHPSRTAHLMRVSGQESKRPVGIALVLSQVKCDAAQQMPERIDGLQIGAGPIGECRRLTRNQVAKRAPRRSQQINRQVFEAMHWRSVGDETSQLVIDWGINVGPF